MENNNQGISKNSTAIKVAELATILYAILVFMSLLIDDAYYSLFQIPIVSYMSPSEILLSCVGQIPQFIKPLITSLAIGFGIFMLSFTIGGGVKFIRWWLLPRLMHSPSIQSKFSVAARYNKVAILVMPMVLLFTPKVLLAMLEIDQTQLLSILKMPLIIEGALIALYFTILPRPNYKIGTPFDWTKHPDHEWIFHRDSIRKHIAFYPFTANERKLIRRNYSARNYIITLLFLIGLYTGQIIVQTHEAQKVMQEGNDVCVVLEGDGIHVDTRDGKTEYIGECAGYVFVYDKQSHGTMVYERKQIRNYLLITGITARANASYNANAEQIYSVGTHIQDSIAQKIDTMAQQVSNVVVDIPAAYQLIRTGTNHLVWHDSLSHTYIEQVILPGEMFNYLPDDKQIFKTDMYVPEKKRTNNTLMCPYKDYISIGQNGEYVRTLIYSADTYTALLFYDPSGQNASLARSFFESVKLKGNCWQKMILIFKDSFTFWRYHFITLGLFGLIVFLIGVFKKETIDKAYLLNIGSYVLVVWGIFMINILMFNRFVVGINGDRWLILLLVLALSFAGIYLCLGLGRIIHLLLPHKESPEQTNPETEEEHKEELTEEK